MDRSGRNKALPKEEKLHSRYNNAQLGRDFKNTELPPEEQGVGSPQQVLHPLDQKRDVLPKICALKTNRKTTELLEKKDPFLKGS